MILPLAASADNVAITKTLTYNFTRISNDGLVSSNPWGGDENVFWTETSGYHYWSTRASAVGARCSVYSRVYTWSKETYPEVIQKVTINAGAWSDGPTSLKLNNREVSLKTMTTSAYAGDESRIKFDDYVFENVITSDNKGHLLLDYITSGQADIFIRSITIEYIEGGGCDMSEIPADNAYYAATSFLCERGVLYGSRDDGMYSVEKELMRKHLANITFRGLFTLKGREIPSTFVSDQYPAIYEDLKSDALYYQAAKTLLYLDYGDGITPFDRDRDGFFPDYSESRINVLKELMEAFNIEPDTEGTDNPFPDDPDIVLLAETSPIRMGYVRQAAKLGIITTEHTAFHPHRECLRGEAFLMLARIIQKIEAGEIADTNPQESDFLDPNYKPKPSEPYAALNDDKTVLTFYYDDQRENRNGILVGSSNATPSWCNTSVTTIVIDPSFSKHTTINRTAFWFAGFSNVTSITGLQNLKTDNVTSMREMFRGCSKLTNLDLSSFNTQNVTDMGAMFYSCNSLTSLDLSGFKTDNVTDMYGMFQDCRSLTSLDLSSFNTQNVTKMNSMFQFCRGLKSLNVSSFKTDNVKGMDYMFYSCSGLTSLDLSGFKTDKVTTTEYMFNNCYRLKTIYVGADWSTTAVTSSKMMFAYCNGLVGGAGTRYSDYHTEHDYAHIDGGADNPGYFTDKNAAPATNAYAVLSDNNTVLTFYYDDQKAERNGMDVGPFSGNGYDFPSWHGQWENITSVIFDDSFANCTTLASTAYWFYNLTNLSSITGISNLKTDNVTNMSNMFGYCSSLKSLDLSGFKTDKVTNMTGMFSWCSNLTSLDVSGFNTNNVTSMSNMFRSCSSLTSLDVSGLNNEKVTSMEKMFYDCNSLTSINLSGFKTDNVTDMTRMFSACYGLKSLNLSNFNTANVTNMIGMFSWCSNLTSIDVTGFKTDNVTNMSELFSGCSSLTTIFADNDWSTAAVTDGDNMFNYCSSLVGGAGTTYNANHTDYTYTRIDGGTANPGYFSKKVEGDLNIDGKVDEADVAVLVSVVMGDRKELAGADLNHDKKVDAADVVTLVKMIMSQK